MKEAEASVLEEYVGKSEFKNHGERVVTGQRLMQATSDIFLGWVHVEAATGWGRPRLLRPPAQGLEGLGGDRADDPGGMAVYGRLCGWTLARAHARSGDRIAIASYLGGGNTFDRAIVEFSKAYADQNEHDYKALEEAVKSGRVKAQTGV